MTDPVPTMAEEDDEDFVSMEEAAAEAGMSVERLVQLLEEGLASGPPIDGELFMEQLRRELEARRSVSVSQSR